MSESSFQWEKRIYEVIRCNPTPGCGDVGLAQPGDIGGAATFCHGYESFAHRLLHQSLWFFHVPGIFREFDAELLYDHETPAESRLSVTIQAASVDMFHERLNNHLKADDFFAVEKYPTMTFVSTQVEPLSDDKASVTGDFTMLGKTLPMTLDVLLIKYAPHPMSGKQPVGFEATGTIDRTEFGMTYRAPFVGEEVRFTITMEAHAQ